MDGASDIIHPRFLHPGGVGNLIESNVGVFRDYGRHGQHFGVRSKLKTLVKSNADVNGGSRYIASNLIIYPNAMMIAAPEHIESWEICVAGARPSARSTVHLRFPRARKFSVLRSRRVCTRAGPCSNEVT